MVRAIRRTMRDDPRECADVRALLTDYLEADLRPGDGRCVERHVGRCPRCRAVLANLRLTIAGLRRLRDEQSPDEAGAVAERALEAWRREAKS